MATLTDLIKKVLLLNTSAEEFIWLENSITAKDNESALQLAFMAVPKFIKNNKVLVDPEIKSQLTRIIRLIPDNWTSHQLARIFIVSQLDPENESTYTNSINTLFETAELNELIALYSSLSFLHYPKAWLPHAVEAVRSNIGTVFDAIAFNNPFPANYFNEAAWNQLVLKAIFNEKNIRQIYGLSERSNKELAYMITDFASERWAANRPVSPHVWALVAPFVDMELTGRVKKMFQSENKNNDDTNLFCKQSGFEPAKDFLKKTVNL